MARTTTIGQGIRARTLLERLEPYTASVLLHVAGVVALVVLVPTERQEPKPEIIEVEIISERAPVAVQKPPVVEPEPPPVVEPDPPLVAIEEPKRPEVVPEDTPVKKVVKRARVYHPEPELLKRDKPGPPDAVPSFEPALPTPRFEIDMSATVEGGDGIEVVAVAGGGGNVLADPTRPGISGLRGPTPPPTRAPDVEVTNTWEITAEPEPINDRRFRPSYPADRKARGDEAAVVVELQIDPSGKVTNARVVRGAGADFNASALAYCRRLRFKPAESNGIPVASRIEWEVQYRFHN